jgi:hypothetical protein
VVKPEAMESVVALFREPQQVQGALRALQDRGFERDHLGFALTDVVAQDTLAQATGVSPEGGAPGGSANVIRGVLTGTLAGLALTVPIWLLLLLIPETRVYQEGGVLAVLFGVIGVKLLRRMGVPAAQAERFYHGLKDGHILVIARDRDGTKADEALSLMRRHGALKLDEATGGGRLQSERDGQDGR